MADLRLSARSFLGGGLDLASSPILQILGVRGLMCCEPVDVYHWYLIGGFAVLVDQFVFERGQPKRRNQVVLKFSKTHAEAWMSSQSPTDPSVGNLEREMLA